MVPAMTNGLYAAIAERWAEDPDAVAISEDSMAWTRRDLVHLSPKKSPSEAERRP